MQLKVTGIQQKFHRNFLQPFQNIRGLDDNSQWYDCPSLHLHCIDFHCTDCMSQVKLDSGKEYIRRNLFKILLDTKYNPWAYMHF